MRKIRSSCLAFVVGSLVAGGAQTVSAASQRPAAPSLIVSHAAAPAPDPREVTALPATPGCSVDPNRELFIIDTSVVQDCFRTTWTGTCPTPVAPATRGAWTLGGLLPGVFGTTDPVKLSNLTKQWLREWMIDHTINGDFVLNRGRIQEKLIDPWLAASGGIHLDLTKAPFRLLAIVFRLDLRRSSGYSGGGTAGEARFVFTLTDEFGDELFSVILEYGLPAATCADIQAWAQRVHNLGTVSFGPNFNAALQAVTDRYTAIGAALGKPNGSAINQVRSNEFFLASVGHQPWELREFKLQPQVVPVEEAAMAKLGAHKSLAGPAPPPPPPTPAPLLQATVAQTPSDRHNFHQIFADYVNANATAIAADNYTVPLSFQSQGFRGAAAPNDPSFWDGPGTRCSSITNLQARHIASRNTCSGCHGLETGVQFLQVIPIAGGPAELSAFLTGTGPQADPCGLVHTFGDIERRRVDLCQLLQKSCAQVDAEQPVSFVH